jgi:hypothetical protein
MPVFYRVRDTRGGRRASALHVAVREIQNNNNVYARAASRSRLASRCVSMTKFYLTEISI